jgi:hypothetical protein
MIEEHDMVALTEDVAEFNLRAGDLGTIVAVYDDGTGFEVEFATLLGETIAVLTLPADAVRPFGPRDIAQARQLA